MQFERETEKASFADSDDVGCLQYFQGLPRRFGEWRMHLFRQQVEPHDLASKTKDSESTGSSPATDEQEIKPVKTKGRKLRDYLSSQKVKISVFFTRFKRDRDKQLSDNLGLSPPKRIAGHIQMCQICEAWVFKETGQSVTNSNQISSTGHNSLSYGSSNQLSPSVSYDAEKRKITAQQLEEKTRLATERKGYGKYERNTKPTRPGRKGQQAQPPRQRPVTPFREEKTRKLKPTENRVSRLESIGERNVMRDRSPGKVGRNATAEGRRGPSRVTNQEEKLDKVQKRKQATVTETTHDEAYYMDRISRLKKIKQLEKELLQLKTMSDESPEA